MNVVIFHNEVTMIEEETKDYTLLITSASHPLSIEVLVTLYPFMQSIEYSLA